MLHVEITYFNEQGIVLQRAKYDTEDSLEKIQADARKKAVAKDSHLHKLNKIILQIWSDVKSGPIFECPFDRNGTPP